MNLDLSALAVQLVAMMFGGAAAFVGGHFAMRVEMAVLRTTIAGLQREADSLRASVTGMKSDIDEAHKRIDRWYEARALNG